MLILSSSIFSEKKDINISINNKNIKRRMSYKIDVLFHLIGFVIFIFDMKLLMFKLLLLILLSSSEEKLKSFQFRLFDLNIIFISYFSPHMGIIKQSEYNIKTKYLLSIFA